MTETYADAILAWRRDCGNGTLESLLGGPALVSQPRFVTPTSMMRVVGLMDRFIDAGLDNGVRAHSSEIQPTTIACDK